MVWVLAGLGVFGVLGVGLVLVLAVANSSGDDSNPPIAQSSYTPADTYSPPATSSSFATPTDTYSPESPSSTPSPTQTVNTGRTHNTIYQAGALPTTSCRTHPEDLNSSPAVRTHLHHLFGCLDSAWSKELASEGIQHSSPHSVLTAGGGTGPCGEYPPSGSGVPYYCSSNNTIYASTSAVAKEYGQTPDYNSMAVDSLFAHEYGHHIQNLTGIMDSYSEAGGSPTSSSGLALSRRLELQATCFAGMFMHSVRGSYPVSSSDESGLVLFNSNVGDWGRGPRNHGTPAHNGVWYKKGWGAQRVGTCNTWTASGSATS